MIEQAFISGQLGKAVYEDGGRYFVMEMDLAEPKECRPMDLSTFFGFGAEVTTVSPGRVDLASLRRQLQTETNAHHALLLIISGLDPDLDLETRSAVIEEAEDLLKKDQAHSFVRARLLSRPLHESADIVKARELALSLNAQAIARLYESVIEATDYIALVQEIWEETAYDYFSTLEQQTAATQELTDLGAFADTITAIVRGNFDALNSLVVTYAQKAELKGVLRPGSLLLNDFRRRLLEEISLSSEVEKKNQRPEREDAAEEDDVSIEAMLAHFKKRRDSRRFRILSADQAKERVDRQIEAISKLIVQGNFKLANRYLTDLISFHVRHDQRKHLAMSLCSLAKVAIDNRSFALAERMVNYALMLGIDDVFILNTHAQLLKALGEFERALAAYEEAMERFPNNEVARNGYAEVLKATGDFDRALAVYEQTIELFPSSEVARSGYAEVLKAMGDFDRALMVYEETMNLFPNNEVSPCGYAEVLKTMGEFDKALAVYEETMNRFPTNAIAPCGYAEVLKTMGEFDRALAVYEEAMNRFPNSEVAPCGYAEVLKATGEFDKALAVYERAMNRFPNNEVAPCGYAEVLKTTGEFDKALAVYEEAMNRFRNNEVPPCGYAEVLKTMGEVDRALAVYEETMSRFPNSEVACNGYAEVLKTRGQLNQALSIYRDTMKRHKYGRVSRNGYASVLVLLNRFEEVRSLLSHSAPRSESDWVDYHIVAMSHLKEGNLDEAIAMFGFGLENAPYTQQAHFVTALAVSKIRKKEFDAVIQLLPTNVSNIDVVQREARLALVVHSQAALGKKAEANQLISELREARNPRVINLTDAISRRYRLGKHSETPLSSSEVDALDKRIEDQEFFLAEAA